MHNGRAWRYTLGMKAIRIILLILIVIGVGLLATTRYWVPSFVNQILAWEGVPQPVVVDTATTTPPQPEGRKGKIAQGVEGIVTIGPTCPVERIPPDPACADKPYKTKLIIGGPATTLIIETGSDGYFSQELPPGTYTISAESRAMLPRLSPVTFTVKVNERTALNLEFDTGIR